VDADFSDRDAIEACQPDIRRIEGEHRLVDRDTPLEELIGPGIRSWLLGAARATDIYRVQLASCDVIRVLDRGEEGVRRVVVCVDFDLSVRHRVLPAKRSVVAYWTLANRDGRWERASIEDEWNGRRHLRHDPLSTPEADVERLGDRAVIERSNDQVAPSAVVKPVGDLVGRPKAEAALQELALIDGRYERAVIESCVRRLLAAWETATNGNPSALEGVAEPAAKQQLLHPDRWLPVVVREPRLRRLSVVELDAESDVPTVTVLLAVRAEPDIRNLDAYWQLALNGPHTAPWTLRETRAWKDEYLFAPE
jgi:hypothetical protein